MSSTWALAVLAVVIACSGEWSIGYEAFFLSHNDSEARLVSDGVGWLICNGSRAVAYIFITRQACVYYTLFHEMMDLPLILLSETQSRYLNIAQVTDTNDEQK